jgi:ATP-binding cassette subfamily B protein
VIQGKFTVAQIMAFCLYAQLLAESMFSITSRIEFLEAGVAGYERFRKTMQIKPKIVNVPNALELKKIAGDVEFRNVSFRYKDNKQNILNRFNLDIKPGEYVALVGSSGVGKTTICNLIPRFYDVTEGSVLIDGIDVRDINLKSLRQNIGFVQQDVYLFAGTIEENIRYGKPNATKEEIIEAAKNANAHDFITTFSDGYNTQVGERGLKLSGGQKQRIAIARVFLKNPPILIFDEATSSLDNESERFIQKSLEKLASSRTTIVIAHRLSTIQNAHRIVVVAQDGIAEEGTHDELINKNGVYKGFYGTQSLHI